MAQWAKMLASNPEHLSLIPGTHLVDGINASEFFSDLYTRAVAAHTPEFYPFNIEEGEN